MNLSSAEEALIGTLVAGTYRIVRKIGQGGMGTVYLAMHEALKKPVALKLLSGAGRGDKEIVQRFEREAVAAANLRHPHICEATDFGRLPNGDLYLVMEYVAGVTLRALLNTSPKGLAHERALRILEQVASALALAHSRDVVHRDLKPENVIVTDQADRRDVVKVIDFGIARMRSEAFGAAGTGLTKAGSVFGTPEYMAPEQVMGKVVDARADAYAFGVMAFELFTGHTPYTDEDMGRLFMKQLNAPVPSARDTAPHLPLAVNEVLTKLLAKRPEDRFATIGEAFGALAAAFAAPASMAAAFAAPGSMAAAFAAPASMAAAFAAPASMAAAPAAAAVTPGPGAAGPMMTFPVAPAATAAGPMMTFPVAPAATASGTIMNVPATPAPGTSGPMITYPVTAAPSAATPTAPPAPWSAAPVSSRRTVRIAPSTPSAASVPVAASASAASSGPSALPGLPPLAAPAPAAVPARTTQPLRTVTAEAIRHALDSFRNPRRATTPQLLVVASAVGLVLVVLLVWLVGGSKGVPDGAEDALAQWEDAKYDAAVPLFRTAIAKTPAIAADNALAGRLVTATNDEEGRRALGRLLDETSFGTSAAMAGALADVATEGAGAARNGALKLLRGRRGLLQAEKEARVALRDADDCAAVERALARLAEIKSDHAQADVEHHKGGRCREMLRRGELCGCLPSAQGRNRSKGKK